MTEQEEKKIAAKARFSEPTRTETALKKLFQLMQTANWLLNS
jgi:hypothetical protein